jgi:hypothetical protein
MLYDEPIGIFYQPNKQIQSVIDSIQGKAKDKHKADRVKRTQDRKEQ